MIGGGKNGAGKPGGARRSGLAATRGRGMVAEFKRIRGLLGRTQGELAVALGISEKAVQSYEQGWRDVPVRVMILMLVLLALYRRQGMKDVPCWEIHGCPPTQRDVCPSFTVGRGQFCWMIGSKACSPVIEVGLAPVLPCIRCAVVQRLLAGHRSVPDRHNASS